MLIIRYNKIVGKVTQYAHLLKSDPKVPDADERMTLLLRKLYSMGVITQPDESSLNNISVSAFCRRRLATVMVASKMVQYVSSAVKYIEQGHVRVGPNVITDPAYLVSRSLEDHLTWVNTSKINRNIKSYNDELDDYDLL